LTNKTQGQRGVVGPIMSGGKSFRERAGGQNGGMDGG